MNTMYEQMIKVNEFYNSNKPLKKVKNTVYKHKTKPEETIEDTERGLAEAFKAGKVLADYELITEVRDTKKELIEMIFPESYRLTEVKQFISVLNELTGVTFSEAKAEEIDGKSEMKKAQQRVYNVAGGAITGVTLGDAIAEAKEVYTKYGKEFKYNRKPKEEVKKETNKAE